MYPAPDDPGVDQARRSARITAPERLATVTLIRPWGCHPDSATKAGKRAQSVRSLRK